MVSKECNLRAGVYKVQTFGTTHSPCTYPRTRAGGGLAPPPTSPRARPSFGRHLCAGGDELPPQKDTRRAHRT
jgi:hypothetical protein